MADTFFLETTTVSVIRTCAEIEEILVDHGASQILKTYVSGSVEGFQFLFDIGGRQNIFRVPFRWREIQKLAENGGTKYRKTAEEDQARRVAARVALQWIKAQFAFIDAGQVQFQEVFMPYLMIDTEHTLYDKLSSVDIHRLLNA